MTEKDEDKKGGRAGSVRSHQPELPLAPLRARLFPQECCEGRCALLRASVNGPKERRD